MRAKTGIVISASHNPYTDNGIKIFGKDGEKISDEMQHAIEAALALPLTMVPPHQLGKAQRVVGAAERYVEYCKAQAGSDVSLRGIRVLMDCAHGATYRVSPTVFRASAPKSPSPAQPNA